MDSKRTTNVQIFYSCYNFTKQYQRNSGLFELYGKSVKASVDDESFFFNQLTFYAVQK